MAPERPTRSLWTLLIAGSLALTLSGVLLADPRERPSDRIDRGIFRMRGLLKNADTKLRNDVAGLSADSAAAGTPVRKCCTSNLKKVGKALVAIQEETDRLRACYDASGQVEHYGALQFFATDVDSLARGVMRFADAPGKSHAIAAYQNIIRTFLQVVESSKNVVRCGESNHEDAASEP